MFKRINTLMAVIGLKENESSATLQGKKSTKSSDSESDDDVVSLS